MINFFQGDILLTSAQALVIPVNCVGVMGKGLALDAKRAFYGLIISFKDACKRGFTIGNLLYWRGEGYDKIVVCFPTKLHYKQNSEYEYIKLGLEKFRITYQKYGIKSIAFPKLGCGLGGLDWDIVKDIMIQYLEDLPIQVFIYE